MDLQLYSFQDCWGLDESLLSFVNQPCLAVILLFPLPLEGKKEQKSEESDKVIWIPQLIQNACGTMAVLHALCNTSHRVTSGPCKLRDLVESLSSMTPEERGKHITQENSIQDAHNDVVHSGSTEVRKMIKILIAFFFFF